MAASYKSSPFTTKLQSFLFRGTELGTTGIANAIGTTGSLYAAHIVNNDAGVRHVSFWDAAAPAASTADVLLRLTASSNITVYIDRGVPFSTAITLTASADATGVTGTADIDLELCIS